MSVTTEGNVARFALSKAAEKAIEEDAVARNIEVLRLVLIN